MRVSHWVGSAFVLFAASAAFGQGIGNGSYSVGVNRMGLIDKVPKEGLTSRYGPRVKLQSGMAEWYGVGFETLAGRVQAVGEGAKADWGGRTTVQFVRSGFTPTGGFTVGKVGDLEIEHTFAFDEGTGCLIIGVTLRNTGKSSISTVMYTREWEVGGNEGGTFPLDWEAVLPPAPPRIWRMAFMPNNIPPGRSQGCVLALEGPESQIGPAAVDVPLARWKNSTYPNGIDFGTCWGIAFTDYDHDGFIDVYPNAARNLWRNLSGSDFANPINLGVYYPNNFEYGSAWADYNNDNLPDFGSEPRGACMALLKNLGNGVFDNVGNDPAIVNKQPCNASSETLSIADVDGDADLDWFLPTYPSWIGSTGNWFLYNDGLNPTTGEYTFTEQSAQAGLDNPPAPVNRPEGAEFCDYDYDGDSDLYSNNTIYRNLSTPGTALFEALTETGSGVVFSDILDEGAVFVDYDMDNDMDLLIAFCDSSKGVRMFENNGDGTFTVQKFTLFDSAGIGLCLGLSIADWDNDGDVDVTSSEVFRRNQWQETKTRHYTVATHSITSSHITDAVPAWGDFDLDGDLDSALGNWGERGRMYENTTYGASTPAGDRRYTRVKVVRDSDAFDDGLETEYGAQVTVTPIGVSDKQRRTGVVSTSGGYLNQSEYTLHFALPDDPDPANPDVDLTFSTSVDLKGSSIQGYARVDRHVNPVLGNIDLAHLDDREILVYRSGRVVLDGRDWAPSIPMIPLTTTTDGLILPTLTAKPPPPVVTPGADWFVGIEISTAAATQPLRLEEVIVDGRLDGPVLCGTDSADTYVWDVTNPAAPVLAEGGLRNALPFPRNERNYNAMDAKLEPGKVYRVVCRVIRSRATPIVAPYTTGDITTNGGLSFQDSSPCTGAGVAAAALDPGNVYLAVRFRAESTGAWADFGNALAGGAGAPVLTGVGTLQPGDLTTVDLTNGAPNAPLFLIVGVQELNLPLFGGTLVPSLDVVLSGFATDAAGAFSTNSTWPSGVPAETYFYVQALIADATAPHGFAFSNAIGGVSPY